MQSCMLNCDLNGPEWAFRRLMRVHRAAHAAAFDRLGLREVGQPMLLFILSDLRRDGERCTQKELAELMERSPSTITNSIHSLEKRGYLRRTADERDKRRKYVEITDEGLVIEERCRRVFDDLDRAMFGSFSPEEKTLLAGLFHQISANLEEAAGCGGTLESGGCGTC
ncbi:MAG: MarR family winged helix-turn-helix transcriptional regulator [Oscillospiraceae bacterium]